MQIRSKDSVKFRKADLTECGEPFCNPGCGWYHIYTFTALPREGVGCVEEETWLDEECRNEQLALVLVDIGDFRACELTAEALTHIVQIMEFFRGKDKQMILRFAYDTTGAGLEREPSDISLVKRHMEQLGGALREFAADILVLQGIFVGNWGEMHGSRFLGERDICELLNTLYRVTEGKCFLAVRTPAQWRMAAESTLTDPGLKSRLALFNDGIFGSATDLGTYGTAGRKEAGKTERWSREEELDWQKRHVCSVPNGGEVLSGFMLNGYREAEEVMRRMHLSYLNSVHQKERLAEWKNERIEEDGCFQGLSIYDYIGCHLGYRFVVRDVKARGKRLQIMIENTGFANLTGEADCFLIIEKENGPGDIICLDTDARSWESGRRIQIQTVISGAGGKIPEGRIFLLLRRKADGKLLRFANEGARERVMLGRYRSSGSR